MPCCPARSGQAEIGSETDKIRALKLDGSKALKACDMWLKWAFLPCCGYGVIILPASNSVRRSMCSACDSITLNRWSMVLLWC